jgi:hypothetical protein
MPYLNPEELSASPKHKEEKDEEIIHSDAKF